MAGRCVDNSQWFNLTTVHHPQNLSPTNTWKIQVTESPSGDAVRDTWGKQPPKGATSSPGAGMPRVTRKGLRSFIMKGKRNNFTVLRKFAYFYIYCCHALERVVCVIFLFPILPGANWQVFLTPALLRRTPWLFCRQPRAPARSTAGDNSPRPSSFPIC